MIMNTGYTARILLFSMSHCADNVKAKRQDFISSLVMELPKQTKPQDFKAFC